MPDRCECCDLPTNQCGRAAEREQRSRPSLPQTISNVFAARHPGTCMAFCGERIEPGDHVCYVDDALIHEDCA